MGQDLWDDFTVNTSGCSENCVFFFKRKYIYLQPFPGQYRAVPQKMFLRCPDKDKDVRKKV